MGRFLGNVPSSEERTGAVIIIIITIIIIREAIAREKCSFF